MVGMGMVALGWVLLLVFIAKLSSIVGQADGGSAWLGRLIIGLAVINVVLSFLYLIGISTGARLAETAGIGPDTFLLLHSGANAVVWFAMLTDALFATAIGVTILVTGSFPNWLGITLIGVAPIEVFAFFGPVEIWAAIGGLVYLWTLLLAVTMLRRADHYSNPEADRRATRPAHVEGP